MRIVLCKCLTVMFACWLLLACQSQPATKGSDFYHSLGGESGISDFVDAYILEIGVNAQLIGFYQNTRLERYKEMQVQYFCVLAGGPCEYSGESLEIVHQGMNISHRDYELALKTMMLAMEKAGWSVGQRNQILARLLEARPQIVHD